MSQVAARSLLTLGCFVSIGSLLMLPLTASGSPERLVSWIALVIGLVAVAGAILIIRTTHRRRHRDRTMSATPDDHVVTIKEET